MATLIGDFRKPVDPTALAPKGLSGALRYWSKQHGSSTVVGLTAVEIDRYRSAAVPLGTIYEDSAAGWMSGGAAAGKQAATYLLGQFRTVGWTPSSLYFADDANTITDAATNACLDAAAQVFGWKPDLYAFTDELTSAHVGGHSRRSWLTGHFPGASISAVQQALPWLHLYQCQGSQPAGIPTTVTVSGVLGDVDIVLRKDWNSTMATLDADDLKAVALAVAGYSNANQPADVDAHQHWQNATAALQGVTALKMQITALSGALSNEQAAILAAVHTQPGLPVDVGALASALAPLLNQNEGAQLVAALRQVFDQASA
ncbi:MAG TPA: hypothetical protein VHX38_02200 [Pseudonocardiaceae bacterium]|nr:hypothetical protein [Pseudonocardiaceae bacterium]